MVVDELLPDQLDHAQHMLGQEEGDLGENHCTLVTRNGVLLGPLLAVEVPVTLGGEELRGGVEEGRRGEGRRKGARVGKGGEGEGKEGEWRSRCAMRQQTGSCCPPDLLRPVVCSPLCGRCWRLRQCLGHKKRRGCLNVPRP